MNATDILIHDEVFRFSGQSLIKSWSLCDLLISGADRCSKRLVKDPHLMMQMIKELADTFAFWQRCHRTGRPPVRVRVT